MDYITLVLSAQRTTTTEKLSNLEYSREPSIAPNLAPNLVRQPSAFECQVIAVISIALQCGVLVFSALATYRWG